MRYILPIVTLLLVCSSVFAQKNVSNFTIDEKALSFRLRDLDVLVFPYSNHSVKIVAENTLPQIETQALVSNAPLENNVVLTETSECALFKGESWMLKVFSQPFSIQLYDTEDVINPKATITDIYFRNDSLSFQFVIEKQEMIFGGGARAIDMNRRGHLLRLRNEPHYSYGWGEENLNFSQPYFVSSNGYSLFYNSAGVGFADIGKHNEDQLTIGSNKSGNELYLVVGNDLKEVHSHFASLVGTQPLPPRWAMGNIMSRFGYTSQADAENMVDKMVAAEVPIDAIVLDLYWFGRGEEEWGMGNLDWNRDSFPKPELMMKEFKKKGIETILITEPFVLKETENWQKASEFGALAKNVQGESFVMDEFWFGDASLVDIFSEQGKEWFWSHYRDRMKEGVSGWWGDLGEPETHASGMQYVLGETNEVHNIYGQYWSKMVADGFANDYPNRRLFHLNRAGFVGVQRFSSFPWSGDVNRSWTGLKPQISIMLGLSMGQVPYASSDLGGFCAAPQDNETYTRWLQFGTFNPIFRPHSSDVPSEVVEYPDSIQNIVKKFIDLRYQMMPYNYNLAYRQTAYGEPLVSPSFYTNQIPKNYWNSIDSYMWGDALFVSAIQEASIKQKDILLPNGVWYNWFSNEKHLGNGWISQDITLNEIPVYAKAGHFVPMVDPFQNTKEYDTAELTIHYFDDISVRETSYEWFNDNGEDRNSLKDKEFERTMFRVERDSKTLAIEVTHSGEYISSSTEERILIFTIHGVENAQKVTVDGQFLDGLVFDDLGNLLVPCLQSTSNSILIEM